MLGMPCGLLLRYSGSDYSDGHLRSWDIFRFLIYRMYELFFRLLFNQHRPIKLHELLGWDLPGIDRSVDLGKLFKLRCGYILRCGRELLRQLCSGHLPVFGELNKLPKLPRRNVSDEYWCRGRLTLHRLCFWQIFFHFGCVVILSVYELSNRQIFGSAIEFLFGLFGRLLFLRGWGECMHRLFCGYFLSGGCKRVLVVCRRYLCGFFWSGRIFKLRLLHRGHLLNDGGECVHELLSGLLSIKHGFKRMYNVFVWIFLCIVWTDCC